MTQQEMQTRDPAKLLGNAMLGALRAHDAETRNVGIQYVTGTSDTIDGAMEIVINIIRNAQGSGHQVRIVSHSHTHFRGPASSDPKVLPFRKQQGDIDIFTVTAFVEVQG